jgi:hypothetical protein
LAVAEIRAEIARLEGQLAAIVGDGIEIWNGREGDVADAPPGGALLHVEWATTEYSYTDWHPSAESAKAALLLLARSKKRTPTANGMRVDLTLSGCSESCAYIERHDHAPDSPLPKEPQARFARYLQRAGEHFKDALGAADRLRLLLQVSSEDVGGALHQTAYADGTAVVLAAEERVQLESFCEAANDLSCRAQALLEAAEEVTVPVAP